jgi:DNA invertase Pin-like site-specific DNA recombinase
LSRGRRALNHAEIDALLEAEIERGVSLTAAARKAGISRTIVYLWMRDPRRRALAERLRAARARFLLYGRPPPGC